MTTRMTTKIVILLNGWVLVGLVEDDHEQAIVFSKAAVIRQWGTKTGPGELARGPTKNTVLDPIEARTFIERRNLLYAFEATGWDEALGADR